MWEELARESDEPFMRELAERYIEKLRGSASPSGGEQPTRPAATQAPKNDI